MNLPTEDVEWDYQTSISTRNVEALKNLKNYSLTKYALTIRSVSTTNRMMNKKRRIKIMDLFDLYRSLKSKIVECFT